MVIADINILCVGEKAKSRCTIQNIGLKIYYNKGRKNAVIYKNRYQAVQKVNGIWYQIYPRERGIGNESYRNEFLDLEGNLRMIFLDKKFKKELLSFIKDVIDSSPSKCIYFFSDLQGYKEKRIELQYREFEELFEVELLSFNTVYQITREEEAK